MHEATVLEEGDTLYVGVLNRDGHYSEVRVANTNATLMVTKCDERVVVNGG